MEVKLRAWPWCPSPPREGDSGHAFRFPAWHAPLAWCSRAAPKVSDTDTSGCSTSDTSVQLGCAGSWTTAPTKEGV